MSSISDSRAWPKTAVEAPPPTRIPRFPADVMRPVCRCLQLHGAGSAAKSLREFYPILHQSAALQIVEAVIKPAAVAFARAVAHGEEKEWRWELHWEDRLREKAIAGHRRILAQKKAGHEGHHPTA